MPTLRDLQRLCYDAFVRDIADPLLPFVAGPDPAASIRIYQNSALEICRGALGITFPVVRKLIGETCFKTLSRDYMRAYPSVSGNLERRGVHFPSLLHGLYHGTPFDYLSDVARLEWACEEACTAPESTVLDTRVLAKVPIERTGELRFELQPAARVVVSPYPVFTIWQTNTDEINARVDLGAGTQRVLVSRCDARTELRLLTASESDFVQALLGGRCFGEAALAADAAVEHPSTPPFDLVDMMRKLSAWQVLADAHLPGAISAPGAAARTYPPTRCPEEPANAHSISH